MPVKISDVLPGCKIETDIEYNKVRITWNGQLYVLQKSGPFMFLQTEDGLDFQYDVEKVQWALTQLPEEWKARYTGSKIAIYESVFCLNIEDAINKIKSYVKLRDRFRTFLLETLKYLNSNCIQNTLSC